MPFSAGQENFHRTEQMATSACCAHPKREAQHERQPKTTHKAQSTHRSQLILFYSRSRNFKGNWGPCRSSVVYPSFSNLAAPSPPAKGLDAMALRQLTKLWVGLATGAAATGSAHCAEQDKYFDPEALERGAKVGWL